MTHSRSVVRLLAAVALSGCLLGGCSVQQLLIGQIYRITTPPAGACPSLTWRFYVDVQNQIHGDLSQPGMQPIAALSGTLNANDQFNIVVKNYSHDRTAAASGQFTADVSTIAVRGDGAGIACDGQTFRLRLGSYFARQGGGGGGGGSGS